MSSSKHMNIDSSFAPWTLLHLLSFLRQGSSPAMKGIPPTDRLWSQAFQRAGHKAAFLPELTAGLTDQEGVAAGMDLDPFFVARKGLAFVLDGMPVIWRKKEG